MTTHMPDSTCKKSGSTHLYSALGDPVIQIFAMLFFLALLSWPVLQIAGGHGVLLVFLYVFLVWTVLVGLLLAVSRTIPLTDEENSENSSAADVREEQRPT